MERFLYNLSVWSCLCQWTLVYLASACAAPVQYSANGTFYPPGGGTHVPDSFVFETSVPPETVCDERTFLMVMVCSHPEHFDHRAAIRETWGQRSHGSHMTFHVMFVVGMVKNVAIQRKLAEESELFRDILQINIEDSYKNLTLKSIAMLKWMNIYCQSAKYLLKSDDDVFINLEVLMTDLHNTIHSRFIMGDIIAGAQPMRDNSSKWNTPKTVYALDTYPKYVSGAAYVISGDLIQDLYSSTERTQFFWIEDVYITSMCAKRINAKHLSNAKFHNRKTSQDPCMWRKSISVHRVDPMDLRRIWRQMQDTLQLCH